MKTIPVLEHHEIVFTLSARGEPLLWKVDANGHISPLGEGEGMPE